MSKSLRLSEKWFQRGLWAVAVIFAWFLIGLGSAVVEDLKGVERPIEITQFVDKAQLDLVNQDIEKAEQANRMAREALDQAQLKHQSAQADTQTELSNLNSWQATSQAIGQDQELAQRTAMVEALRAIERKALAAMQSQQQVALDAQQLADRQRARRTEMERAADAPYQKAKRDQELRVFGYRLALTLPLLVAALWLYRNKRKSNYWPFVWGFIYFALFAFFVELVPYLPSYGGYVRYVVGLGLTVLIGRQAIVALNRYLEAQRQAEAQPQAKRQATLDYDLAIGRLAKGICPGCERTADLKDTSVDFCAHCGIGLFDYCHNCKNRKSAFGRFCHCCGTPKAIKLPNDEAAGSA